MYDINAHTHKHKQKKKRKNENKSCKLYSFDIFYLKNIIKKKNQ